MANINLNTLYRVVKDFATYRDGLIKCMNDTKHLWRDMTEAEKDAHIKEVFNANNLLVSNSAADYKKCGGKRDINKFIRLPMV